MIAAVGAALLFVFLYVLSLGPSAVLHDMGTISDEALLRVYYPVLWACEYSDTFGNCMDAYYDWWSRQTGVPQN